MPNNDYGTQLCVEDGNIWVGTKRGQVFLYDQDDFELVENLTSAIGHNNQITGLHCDAGHVLTCAMDRSARMNQPTRSADLIWQYQADAGKNLET
jgi:outer membrane protein assembly factor BamB